MPAPVAPELSRQGLPAALRQVLERELPDAFDTITWEIAPGAETPLQDLPPLAGEVLFYAAREAIRNAARHGRDPRSDPKGALNLRIAIRAADELEIIVEDDGRGMGDSAPETGRGLALHATMMAVVGGTLAVDSRPNAYTRLRLTLPLDTIR
jgi:signal transduction histidine kinase